jgi:polyhydroxyalkanoate synthesis regulator phasin
MDNRYVCSVLEEMRKCHEVRNYSYLPGLIEEAQTMVNRMEAALWDKKDYTALHDKLSKLKKEVAALEAKKQFLSPEDEPKNPRAGTPFDPERS